MSRRSIFWMTVAAGALAALAWIWFLDNFDRIPVEQRTAPQQEALRNLYLAAHRLLAELGYRVETSHAAATLDALPPGGTLILSGDRQYHLTPSRVEALFRWIEAGGYLIAEADRVNASDPVLRRFDVSPTPRVAPQPEEKPDEDADEAADKEPPQRPSFTREPVRVRLDIPGYARPLRMRAGFRELYPGKVPVEWSAQGPAVKRKGRPPPGYQLLHYRLGNGQVTLLNGLYRFNNALIDRDDHAEVLAALLAVYQPKGEVRILTALDVPSLWEWLAHNALAALASAALLLALWLWRVIPRFGVLHPDPVPARRSLLEHLRGVGRFLWRRRSVSQLLEAARSNFLARLSLRHSALAALPTVELALDLARRTGRPRDDVVLALAGEPRTAEDFTLAMRTLSLLEQELQ
jgi:hypothetical protein